MGVADRERFAHQPHRLVKGHEEKAVAAKAHHHGLSFWMIYVNR